MSHEKDHSDIFIVNGVSIVNKTRHEYHINKEAWERECASIDNEFVEKTSNVKTSAGNEKSYTNWYRWQPSGGLKIVSKDRPNLSEYYNPEPFKQDLPEITPFIKEMNHLIMPLKTFKKYKKLFKNCFCFPMSSKVI